MSKQFSNKHHYIPEFLIKKFADKDGKIWVYNKLHKRFEKLPKSPAGVFYEIGRNTFDHNGAPSDHIERKYSELETHVSKTLDRVLKASTMSGEDLTMLIYFASLMKWRMPKVDEEVRNLVRAINIEDLGLKVVPEDPNVTASQRDMDEINSLDIVVEIKRLLLSVQPITNQEKLSELYKSCFLVTHYEPPGLLGDYMIIEEPNKDYQTLGNFIFPLSDTKTLICKRGGKQENPHDEFPMWKDLAIFHLSTERVACRDKEYLREIVEHYSKLEAREKTDEIIKHTFSLLA